MIGSHWHCQTCGDVLEEINTNLPGVVGACLRCGYVHAITESNAYIIVMGVKAVVNDKGHIEAIPT